MNKSFVLAVCGSTLMMSLYSCNIFKKTSEVKEPQKVSAPVTQSGAAKESDKSTMSEELDGEWIIESVASININSEENHPYVHFVPAESSFYASNGCNVLNGLFTVGANSQITFHNVITTMRYCPETPYEREITRVLSDNSEVTVKIFTEDGNERMNFLGPDGNAMMTMRRPGMDFLNGNWRVAEINGEEFNNSEMTIFFDMAERKVHGNTGCNSFNGDIYIDPVNTRTLSLTNMAVTMRMCPNLDQQRKFLVALEQATGAKAGNNGTAFLTDSAGKDVIKLVHVE